ncbi:hypothetical protein ACFFX1_34590 [Dactylosporangium sucinum]|uniref:Uncharacterized protein n=1 Tax=Dactylosporangium sucinum TaxID=1424081 RepID=A0A917U2Q6_9ACTN|nr:hypothetical protein [Dactylosporangium sucinum]GGM50976.1 hypothetical protein GCM10007977_060960 [Dactylosporangium sucinum]
MNARAWAAARNLAAALRGGHTERTTTRRRWFGAARACPSWCASDHRCTAQHGYSGGEHRSEPLVWRTDYGTLMASRVETLSRAGHVELRLSVRLDSDDQVAALQARMLTAGVDLAASAILAAAKETGRPALRAAG